MSKLRYGNNSLVHFAILMIFGLTVTVFIIYKANQVISNLENIERIHSTIK